MTSASITLFIHRLLELHPLIPTSRSSLKSYASTARDKLAPTGSQGILMTKSMLLNFLAQMGSREESRELASIAADTFSRGTSQ